MVGSEGEADLDAGDAGLGAEVGQGGCGGRASDVLGPGVYLLRREGVDPGAAHGDAEVDDASSGHFDDGERADCGRALLVIVFSQRLPGGLAEQRGSSSIDSRPVIGGELTGDADGDAYLIGLRANGIVGGGAGGVVRLAYAAFVAQVGSGVQAAQSTQGTQQAVLTAVSNQRQSVSGVSLDEEMTNLIQYQQAYQASARVMNAINSTLDTLINSVGAGL